MTYRRSDYRFERSRMVQGPLYNPLPPLVPLWHEWASTVVLVALLALLAWWH